MPRAAQKTSRGLDTPGIETPNAPGTEMSSPPCRGGEVHRRAISVGGGAALHTVLTPEEEQELLREKFRHIRSDKEPRPRRPSEWLLTGGPGAMRFDDLSTSAHVIVVVAGFGVLVGEVIAVADPGMQRRAFVLRPWGWAKDLRVVRRDVRSIRLVPAHGWRERQIVAKQQKAKLEGAQPPKEQS